MRMLAAEFINRVPTQESSALDPVSNSQLICFSHHAQQTQNSFACHKQKGLIQAGSYLQLIAVEKLQSSLVQHLIIKNSFL